MRGDVIIRPLVSVREVVTPGNDIDELANCGISDNVLHGGKRSPSKSWM